jgi:tetratricopeptide (TPR) repeat protein
MDVAAISALRQHSNRTGDYLPLAEGLERYARALADSEGDPHELGQLHFELGNLWRDRLSRVDRAIGHYRTAIDFDAAQRPAMQAARLLFAQAGKWDQVAKLLSREGESLPGGQKRAGVFVELAKIHRERLGDAQGAAAALREAIESDLEDLQVQHDLATLLLDEADRDRDARRAETSRREAADILCRMARAVSDDYAFAYVEAALDAVPDHGDSLELLEQLAPRVGRPEGVAPRWVAGLQAAPNGPLSRDLRLKLSRAYIAVGQLDDARVCLQPLLDAGDREATQVAASLKPSKRPQASAAPEPAPKKPSARPREQQRAPERASAGNDLAALAARDAAASRTAADPLADLARLDAGQEESSVEALDSEELNVQSISSDDVSVQTLASEELSVHSSDEQHVQALASAELAALPDDDLSHIERDIHSDVTQRRAHEAEPEDAHTPQVGIPTSMLRASERPPAEIVGGDTNVERLDADETSRTTGVPDRRREVADEVAKLRADLDRKLRYRDLRGAADLAELLLNEVPTDSQAITAIEDYCRATRDFKRMRELALRVAREPAFPVETRISRLREAAMLSESKLGDADGTIAAWRELHTLAPQDAEARSKLHKLLARNQRWDELAQLLERDALMGAEADRAQLYREIAAIHRDKRENLADAIEALESARDLEPGRREDEDALLALFTRSERYRDVAALLEMRLARAADDEKLSLLRSLAELFEIKLEDRERAYEFNEQILKLVPLDPDALDRRERIDEKLGRFDQVLRTVKIRLSAADTDAQRVALLLRVAELCGAILSDREGQLAAYSEAIALAPSDFALIDRVERAFDNAERGPEFTRKLERLREGHADEATRLTLLRRIATRLVHEDDLDAAIRAHEQLLDAADELDTRRTLVGLLERSPDRARDLAREIDVLAGKVSSEEAKVLRVSRAELLHERLSDTRAASDELWRVVQEISPDDVSVLERLATFAQETSDTARVAKVKRKLLDLSTEPRVRIQLSQELADLYQGELADKEGATFALSTWSELEAGNPRPYLRLVPLLEEQERYEPLVHALDALAALSVSEDESADFLLRAARIASQRLSDHDGAWRRLVPRVVDASDAAAEEALREVAKAANRGSELAELYVGLAQRGDDVPTQVRRWMDAAAAYEGLGLIDKALEAALRALSKDMDSSALLDEVDRLAAAANAWPRLHQVYDALTRRAESTEGKVRALSRHARLLEEQAKDVAGAFTRIALATQVNPASDLLYAEAKRLATASGMHEEALHVHERRASHAGNQQQRLAALLEACVRCQRALADAPRAMGYLARAVTMAGADKEILGTIESTVKHEDEVERPLDGRGLTYALAQVLRERAEDARREPSLSAVWLSRAAVLIEESLGDAKGAFEALERAASLAPGNEIVLDSLEQVAERAGELPQLAEHYRRAADDALDSNTASISLRRLGMLLEDKLDRAADAAEVYKQLVTLRPRDIDVANHLRSCLKSAGLFKDLLSAIDRQLVLVDDEYSRLALMRDAADTWENGLKNRFEALDAWKRIASVVPDDPEARDAIARLSRRVIVDEASLLEGDLVVRPEDLAPSVPPKSGTVKTQRPALDSDVAIDSAQVTTQIELDHATPAYPAHAPNEVRDASVDAIETTSDLFVAPQRLVYAEEEEEHHEAARAALALERGGESFPGGETDPAPAPAMTVPPHEDDDGDMVASSETALIISGEAPLPFERGFDDASTPARGIDEPTHLDVDVDSILGAERDALASSTREEELDNFGDLSELANEEDVEILSDALPGDSSVRHVEVTTGKHRAPVAPPVEMSPLLADLATFDASTRAAEAEDVELLPDSGVMELEGLGGLEEEAEPGAPDTLDALNSMLERGPLKTNPPSRHSMPSPPPARRPDAPARPSVPPPPPRTSQATPPPVPLVDEASAASRPPPPPRRD